MFNKLKQIKDLRKQASSLKSNLSKEIVTGEAAGGKIKIGMNGNQEIQEVYIEESLLSSDNKNIIEEGIKEALSKAFKEIQALMLKKIQSGDIEMPNL